MAGLAVMVAAVALTVMLPVAGLVASLAVITLLRAADRAQSTLAVRRSVRGPRASDLLVVVVTAPLTVARALLTEVLIAPLAVAAGAATFAVAVVVTHSLNLPRAGAYAAAAVVAWYGLGPGSGRPRRQLNRMAGAAGQDPDVGGGDRARRLGAGGRRRPVRLVAGPVLLARDGPASARAAQPDHVSGELAAQEHSRLTPRRDRPAAPAWPLPGWPASGWPAPGWPASA